MISGIKKYIKLQCLFFLKTLVLNLNIKTRGSAARIKMKSVFIQSIFGFNIGIYWPTHHSSVIRNPENILIGVGTTPGLSSGCYIQGGGKVYIGDYTITGPNVGIISANHNVYDLRSHNKGVVKIGKYCWIGMNSTILPNVELGDHTIVGAGSIVTKSFSEGYCIIAGNPATIIKYLDKNKVVEYENEHEYYGYIPKKDFHKFRKKYLTL